MSFEVSVVAATHNREDRLRALLDGLRAQTLGTDRFEVVIIDDGSSDGTPAVLAEAERRGDLHLRTSRQDPASGPAAARNRGWRVATAPVIAFTDDDCVPAPGWLEALIAAMGTRPSAFVQGRTEPNVDERGAMHPYAKTVSITAPSPHFETCNIAYPRALLERIGGFDESYPAPAGEDGDLGWRAKAAGGVPLFEADALVYHAVHPGTPLSGLRAALMAEHGVQSYKDNPALRSALTHGIFYDRSHPLLFQAALGAWLSRRQPVAAAFCLPYLMNIHARARASGGGMRSAPYFVVYDTVQVVSTMRGAIRHRFPVL